MTWIIDGIVLLAVTIWSLKGTTFAEYSNENRVGEFHVPVWVLVIAFVIYCIPYAGFALFILYSIWFLVLAARKPSYRGSFAEYIIIELSDKNALHRMIISIGKLLTRTI